LTPRPTPLGLRAPARDVPLCLRGEGLFSTLDEADARVDDDGSLARFAQHHRVEIELGQFGGYVHQGTDATDQLLEGRPVAGRLAAVAVDQLAESQLDDHLGGVDVADR